MIECSRQFYLSPARIKYCTAIHNVTAQSSFKLVGLNPYMITNGMKADISNLCCFKFYEWVYYWDPKEKFLEQKGKLIRVLGPTKLNRNEMAQWILTEKA